MLRPIGREFLVNVLAERWQEDADATLLASGDVVVVWSSAARQADTETRYVAGRVFAPDGTPRTGEYILSDEGFDATRPRVAALEGGGFAVAWQTQESLRDFDEAIFAATYEADFSAWTPITRVSPLVEEEFLGVEISAHPGGGFSVHYTGDDPSDDWPHNEVWSRPFSADGAPLGASFKVNRAHRGDQANPRAAELSNGDTVVIWDSEESSRNEVGNWVDDMRGRVLTPDGRPRGPEFVLTDDANPSGWLGGISGGNTDISVAALTGGRFVATWYRTVLEGNPGGEASYQIVGRVFDHGGRPVGTEFQVNAHDESVPAHSSVAALEGGGFAVLYDVSSPTDDPWRDVFLQAYSEWGRPIGGNVLVTSGPDGDQVEPSAVGLEGGGLMAVWTSEYVGDGEYEAVVGRVFDGLAPGQAAFGGPNRPSAGPDRLSGGPGDDRIAGGGGSDLIRAGRGDDRVAGGAGDDLLFGHAGHDRVAGGGGDDRLEGGSGRDALFGGGGDDRLAGGAGDDRLIGGPGDDRIAGGGGADQLLGGSGRDGLFGGGGRDRLVGGSGDDRIAGGGGDDRLSGGSGRDGLFGGAGADRLDGGAGNDRLGGGAGADAFVFRAGGGRDVALDFRDGVDEVVLDHRLWDGALSARQVVARFAEEAGGDVVLRFDGGEQLAIRGLAGAEALHDDLVIV